MEKINIEEKPNLEEKIKNDKNKKEMKPLTDLQGFIIYPSLYKQDYKEIHQSVSANNYILESLNIIDLDLWKKAFTIDNNKNITINHKFFSKLMIHLQNSINGSMCMVGKSFAKQKLNMGTFYFYYLQFLANFIFQHPSAIAPFKNDQNVKNKIFNIIENIVDNFYDKNYLDELILTQFLKEDTIVFSENDIVQFKITIEPPKIFLTKIHEIKIPVTNWYITIKMNSKSQTTQNTK